MTTGRAERAREPGGRAERAAEGLPLRPREFRALARVIHAASGVALPEDKRDLLASRLRPLLVPLGLRTFAGLAAAVVADPSGETLGLVLDRATTNTTAFFRHRAQLQLLRAALPELGTRGRLRLWSAGCSSGEEPYSLALLLLESGKAREAKVLATDVSRRALARARAGVYTAEQIEPVPSTLLPFFERAEGGMWSIGAAARALVTFRHHDLRDVHGQTRAIFDAILCRNVLIYFDPASRAATLGHLARLLRPGGLLFLGPSESGIALPDGFARIGPATYRKG